MDTSRSERPSEPPVISQHYRRSFLEHFLMVITSSFGLALTSTLWNFISSKVLSVTVTYPFTFHFRIKNLPPLHPSPCFKVKWQIKTVSSKPSPRKIKYLWIYNFASGESPRNVPLDISIIPFTSAALITF